MYAVIPTDGVERELNLACVSLALKYNRSIAMLTAKIQAKKLSHDCLGHGNYGTILNWPKKLTAWD